LGVVVIDLTTGISYRQATLARAVQIILQAYSYVPETHAVAPDHPIPPPSYVSIHCLSATRVTYIGHMQTAVQRLAPLRSV
jgi:hypothetical protein